MKGIKMPKDLIAYALVPSLEHDMEGHPENPGRFAQLAIPERLPFAERMLRMQPLPDIEESILAVHPASFLEALKKAATRGPAYIDPAPTYVTPGSYQAALRSAGGVLATLDAIISGKATSGFALTRPPGHHATPTRAMGFCLLNNIAIATRFAQRNGRERVAIIDIDVHHGNGTQDIFEADGDVLYLSTHQRGIYPGTGHLEETGRGEGRGSLVNIPLPALAGDQAFAEISTQVIEPICERFSPQLILVSCGFDSHWMDPLASLQLTSKGYYQIACKLIGLAKNCCQGAILFVLEGGYDPAAVAQSAAFVLHALAGSHPPPDALGDAPYGCPDISSILNTVRSIHNL
jgi:acetoin utilization deacetylase AcuC-like enzyme